MAKRRPKQPSPLTPELKDFIDKAIVPCLVKLWDAETREEVLHRAKIALEEAAAYVPVKKIKPLKKK